MINYDDTRYYPKLAADQSRRHKRMVAFAKFLFALIVVSYMLALGSAWADDGESHATPTIIKVLGGAVLLFLIVGTYASHLYVKEMDNAGKNRHGQPQYVPKPVPETMRIKIEADTSQALAALAEVEALSKRIAESYPQCKGLQPPCKFDCPCWFGAKAGKQPYAELTDEQIRVVFLTHGFTIKEGQPDLKQYVYDAARALLALQQQNVKEAA